MAGQRKTLGSLVQATDLVPVPPLNRPDRPARADKPANPGEVAAREKPAAAGEMTMRSWYMPKASADRLAALVDDVHFATRLPKHLIMGALVNVIDRHRAEVETEARSAVEQAAGNLPGCGLGATVWGSGLTACPGFGRRRRRHTRLQALGVTPLAKRSPWAGDTALYPAVAGVRAR
jgi:hypothetical protein